MERTVYMIEFLTLSERDGDIQDIRLGERVYATADVCKEKLEEYGYSFSEEDMYYVCSKDGFKEYARIVNKTVVEESERDAQTVYSEDAIVFEIPGYKPVSLSEAFRAFTSGVDIKVLSEGHVYVYTTFINDTFVNTSIVGQLINADQWYVPIKRGEKGLHNQNPAKFVRTPSLPTKRG